MTDRPPNVIFADRSHEAAIFDFLVGLHRVNSNGWGIAFDPAMVRARIEVCTRREPAERTNPKDERRGFIGIILAEDGQNIAAAIGLYIEPIMWFSNLPGLVELFLHVRPDVRDRRRLERDLFAFVNYVHEFLKSDLARSGYTAPFPLSTGFVHRGNRFPAMERLWRMASGAVKVGVLYMRD